MEVFDSSIVFVTTSGRAGDARAFTLLLVFLGFRMPDLVLFRKVTIALLSRLSGMSESGETPISWQLGQHWSSSASSISRIPIEKTIDWPMLKPIEMYKNSINLLATTSYCIVILLYQHILLLNKYLQTCCDFDGRLPNLIITRLQ